MPTAVAKSLGFAEGSLFLRDKVKESQPLHLQTFPRLSWTEQQVPGVLMKLYKGWVGGLI